MRLRGSRGAWGPTGASALLEPVSMPMHRLPSIVDSGTSWRGRQASTLSVETELGRREHGRDGPRSARRKGGGEPLPSTGEPRSGSEPELSGQAEPPALPNPDAGSDAVEKMGTSGRPDGAGSRPVTVPFPDLAPEDRASPHRPPRQAPGAGGGE